MIEGVAREPKAYQSIINSHQQVSQAFGVAWRGALIASLSGMFRLRPATSRHVICHICLSFQLIKVHACTLTLSWVSLKKMVGQYAITADLCSKP